MHYYKKNIGDYFKKAGRLSMLEHGAYTLLIDSCYDRERFPTRDEAIDWAWARSADEISAVDFVLTKFFKLQGGLYIQDRILEELHAYHAQAETNKRIATEREAKRTNRARSVNETPEKPNASPPNQEPLTINHKPVGKALAAKRRTQIPADFEPDETGTAKANESGIAIATELERFKDFHRGKGSTMADWQAAWRTWVSNAVKFSKGKTNGYVSGKDAERKRVIRGLTGYDPDAISGVSQRID